jgi:DNA-binding transcriptional ArsR family regulator
MTGGPAEAQIADDAEIFRVLGHETRLRLLALLATGELAVSEIDAASGIGQPGLSQQLAILRKAQLVTTRRAAKQVYYRVDRAAVQRSAALLLRLVGENGAANPAATAAPDSKPPHTMASAAGFARMV